MLIRLNELVLPNFCLFLTFFWTLACEIFLLKVFSDLDCVFEVGYFLRVLFPMQMRWAGDWESLSGLLCC